MSMKLQHIWSNTNFKVVKNNLGFVGVYIPNNVTYNNQEVMKFNTAG
jgi:hypothetical protein